MKKVLFALMALSLAVVACKEKEDPAAQLVVDFTISANPVYAGEEVVFTAKVSGGVAPYTYEWAVGEAVKFTGETAKWTPEENNTYKVTLKATDSKKTSVERTKNLVVEPAPVIAKGEVTLIWNAQLEGYTSITSPSVADDGSIYTTTRDKNKFYKISKDGAIVWEKAFLNNPQSGSQVYGTPAIDTDGTIYMCGGTKNGDATVVAYNPDGTEKWRFSNDKFWNKGNTPSAAINGGTSVGIGPKNIYIGNVGSAGTIIAIDKATGERVNYMMGADGSGPAGGCRGGVIVNKDASYIGWCGGAYGIFGASTTALDAAGEGTPWAWRSCYSAASGWPLGNNQATIAAMKVGDKDLLIGMVAVKNGDGAFDYEKIYGVDFATGEEVVSAKIDACAQQDQGGISVTEDNLIIATLKYTLGQADGGIALVDPVKNEMVAHYGIAENVTSAPAIDQAGNIHFGTEVGNYYVVKYNGNGDFETLVKTDIAQLVKNDTRYAEAYKETEVAKIWSGIVICDDGTILVQYTDNENRALGGLAAINVDYTTGPSTVSQWPMMGGGRKHTNRQK
ncbi:MAG: PQQ-binding-like beta-propeller repeat protein [Bacteroidales bacterium]|nr:PQQ-binding-like beta-propeller repeat protein [Bacteroidales bacterium]